MNIVPWRLPLLPGKRFLRAVASLDLSSLSGFDHNAARFENRALVLPGEVHGNPLTSGLHRQNYVLEKVALTFYKPDRARDRRRDLDRSNLLPTLKTAMCFHREVQQVGHEGSYR